MGLSVRLKTEKDEQRGSVDDPRNLLARSLPSEEDRSFRCLGFIDLYGDTVFNYLQMPDLIDELKRIDNGNSERSVIIAAVKRLAELRRDERLYLWFYGD